jgi:N-acyl-phosphatidylethanolamine-hydrolysing phospholipase D
MPAHHAPSGGFRNPWPGGKLPGFAAFLKWVLWERLTKPRPADPDPRVFERRAPDLAFPRGSRDAMRITWVGHSTFVLQLGGLNLLTDPMWSERAAPVRFAGPRRWVPPGVSRDALPPIDVVLISHNHYDHLDDATVRWLAARDPAATWLAPVGVGSFLRARGVGTVAELDWLDDGRVGEVTVACTPAQHFSSRGFGDRDRTLWCGWTVRHGARAVYFAGDTGYHPAFTEIGARYGPFDAALLPVGAYEPRWFMRAAHMNPEEAVRAYLDLRGTAAGAAPLMVPMHWGTFKLTDEPMDEPPARVRAAWSAAGLPGERLWVPAHGETRVVGRSGGPPD